MSIFSPDDTLAFHQARVLTRHRDMRDVSCSSVAERIQAFMDVDTKKGTVPENEALWFYGLNHGMSVIKQKFAPQQPLPKWELEFVSKYHEVLGPKAVRAFYYLVLICTREFRHCHSWSKTVGHIEQHICPKVAQFFNACGKGESGIHQSFLNNPPDAKIGDYVRALQYGFYKGSWGGGYGGKAWGAVTDCLVHFVLGEYTAEMMLDTNWTLCHNNGPIFNKGMLYGMYNGSVLKRILDLQRGGQIPVAGLFDPPSAQYVDAELKACFTSMLAHWPDEFKGYVDWVMVEALGSLKSYSSEKAKQMQQHGTTAEGLAAIQKAEEAAQAAKEAKLKKLAEEQAKYFVVDATTKIEKMQFARAA